MIVYASVQCYRLCKTHLQHYTTIAYAQIHVTSRNFTGIDINVPSLRILTGPVSPIPRRSTPVWDNDLLFLSASLVCFVSMFADVAAVLTSHHSGVRQQQDDVEQRCYDNCAEPVPCRHVAAGRQYWCSATSEEDKRVVGGVHRGWHLHHRSTGHILPRPSLAGRHVVDYLFCTNVQVSSFFDFSAINMIMIACL